MSTEALTREPIDLAAMIVRVSVATTGAVSVFQGLVRNHHAGREVSELEYSAYEPMAEVMMATIIAEAVERWPVRVAVRHRLGLLAIGDAAVAVAVAGSHRDEAFEACRFVIEQVKKRVPIWKRERYADGSEAWVDPTTTEGSVPAAAKCPR